MVSSSSTKKAARLAQKGKGKTIRFQGGTLFPLIILAIVVVGLGTIVYARQSVPAADATPPTANDHWHGAYGFDLCDEESSTQLAGAKEEADGNGQLISSAFLRTGVHSHDDGVIHWHAYTSAAVGRNAKLGVFMDVYDVELTDDSLKFPDEQGGKEYSEEETLCDGEPGVLKVNVWNSFSDTGDGTVYVSNFDDIPFDRDGMVFTISFQPEGTDTPMPPWAPQLPTLGAADTGEPVPQQPEGSVPPGDTVSPGGTIAPSDTVAEGGTIEPTGTAPAGTAPAGTGSTATTVPAGTQPPTTS